MLIEQLKTQAVRMEQLLLAFFTAVHVVSLQFVR